MFPRTQEKAKITQIEPKTLENHKKDVSKLLKPTHAVRQNFLASSGEIPPPLEAKNFGALRVWVSVA